jgi:hypothetical protein
VRILVSETVNLLAFESNSKLKKPGEQEMFENIKGVYDPKTSIE